MIREGEQFFYMNARSQYRPEKAGAKLRRHALKQRYHAYLMAKGKWPADLLAKFEVVDAEDAREAAQFRPTRPHRRIRRMKPELLRTRILAAIVATDKHFVCKEDLAREFQVADHAVGQVLHRLNLEGVVDQPHHTHAHDTNRNPMFFGPRSGWASDLYPIRDRARAAALLRQGSVS